MPQITQPDMSNITRQTFLKQCFGAGAVLTLSPYFTWAEETDNFFERMVKNNNQEVEKLLKVLEADITDVRRRLGFDIANLSAALAEPTSRFYQKMELIPSMTKILKFLIKYQKDDGTLDLGNLASPPDTAFILEPLCTADAILRTMAIPQLDEVKSLLKTFILKAGEAMRLGGVHTPNHRWVISAALARINDLYPDKKYVKRIDEWLSENIFIDADGHYLERSMIYSEVTDNCLITMARLLKRPKLYDYVRKNLNMTYFYIEPNGDLVTNDSRRQDQFMSINALYFYQVYRYMANHDTNAEYAAICKSIEKIKGFDEKSIDFLAFCLEDVILKKPLPSPKQPSVNFVKAFPTTNLVRIRRNDTTMTIFGGTDKPTIIGSGRSTSPNFFSFRKGEAILKYMRFSTDFFSTGYFRSDGLMKEGNKFILKQRLESPYYQPLPEKLKRADGNYKHAQSTDSRFWNKMDFQNRPQSNIKHIETTISIAEKDGNAELNFKVQGADGVKVTIEFCFKEGGDLIGLKKLEEGQDNFTLESGSGEYKFGKDLIKFSEGIFKHSKLRGLEGEMYTSHFGSLRTDGMHVFLTGITPFEHKVMLS